jgi:Mg2+/Co2+ transporter CorB
MTFLIILIIFLLLLSAFFSSSETGLTASSEAKLHKLRSENHVNADKVLKLLKDKDNLLSSLLIINNGVNILAATIATSIAIAKYGQEWIFLTALIVALIIIIFCDMLPKTYAFENPEKVALFSAPILIWFIKILKPINYVITKFVNFLLLPFSSSTTKHITDIDVRDVLKGTIDYHHEEGDVVKEDRHMLGSILDMESATLSQIMHHRKDLEAISINLPIEKIISKVFESTYTRIPLYKNNVENIIGIIHSKTLMRALYAAGNDAAKVDIEKIMVAPWFVPDTTTLKDQLMNFRAKRNHFAIVVDEYSSILGFITLEDILEVIVGNIEDEYDVSPHNIQKLEDGSLIVEGSLNLRELNRALDFDLPTEASTIAGLIIRQTEIIPDVNQIFSFYGYRFEILKKNRNQITKIKISKIQEAQTSSEEH